jgi:hypothetical protein
MAFSFLRIFYYTQQRTTVGRTNLDEWSARRRYLHQTTYNTHTSPRQDLKLQSQQDLCTYMTIPPTVFLRMNIVADKFAEKIETHFVWSITFLGNRAVNEIISKIWYSRWGNRRQRNTVRRMRCTCWMNNTYCLSTATMVAQKRLNFAFMCTLLFLLVNWNYNSNNCIINRT